MKLLIIGKINGFMAEASKMAIDQGVKVTFVESIDDGLQTLLKGNNISVVFIDLNLDFKNFLESLKINKISTPVISCGIGTDEDLAAESIKCGAKEYLPLPPNTELIAEIFASVSKDKEDFIFKDPKMLDLISMAKKVAKSDANILITGESGTGKEVLTQFIHKNSNRSKGNFVALNCAAIPDNLLESELFGHEKGAFTGALNRRIGKFEEADNGTLFLDEISEMNLMLQAKLLRAIQEREIVRVGGNKPIQLNIRIIATSNRNLMDFIQEKKFREDLYYRLNVINLKIPPLRERKDDIEPIAEHFLEKYSKMNGIQKVKTISKSGFLELKNYDWPGNVRELENTIHRAILLTDGDEINHFDNIKNSAREKFFLESREKSNNFNNNFSDDIRIKDDDDDSSLKSLAEIEKNAITKTLNHCLGNKTHTANILGISIRTLRNKLQQYEMDDELKNFENVNE